MTVSEEVLMAYVDGELDAQGHAAVEAALAVDPVLARRIARHRELRARLRAAFNPGLDESLSERVIAAARRLLRWW